MTEQADGPLSAQIASLNTAVQVIHTVQEGQSKQLDTIAAEVRLLSERSAAHLSNTDSIKRLWEFTDANAKAIIAIDKRVSSVTSFGRGMAALFVVVVSVLGWIALDKIADINETAREVRAQGNRFDDRMDRVEIYLAGPKSEGYKR